MEVLRLVAGLYSEFLRAFCSDVLLSSEFDTQMDMLLNILKEFELFFHVSVCYVCVYDASRTRLWHILSLSLFGYQCFL